MLCKLLLGLALCAFVGADEATYQCTLCPDAGESVPNPNFVPFGGAPGYTCGVFEVEAMLTTDPDRCFEDYQTYVAGVCGCKSYVPPVDANCTTVCSDGSNVPNPDAVAFFATGRPYDDEEYSTTCRQLEAVASVGDAPKNVCSAIEYIGINQCGCEGTLPSPTCTLCQDGSFPRYAGALLTDSTVCAEFALMIQDEQDADVCSAFQQYAAEYCGCNVVDDDSVCRICGDKLLPFPEDRIPSLAEGKDCGSLELEANLDKSLCDSYQAAYQDGCSCDFSPTEDDDMVVTDDIIGFDCTICPGGESVPDPNFVPFTDAFGAPDTCGVLEVGAVLTTDPSQCAEIYHGYIAAVCGCESYVPPVDANCTTVCSDGSNVPNSDAIAFFETDRPYDDEEYSTTCRQLEAATSIGDASSQTCSAIEYIGINQCGCEGTLPSPTCTLCQDGSFPRYAAALLTDSTVCAEFALMIRDEQDADVCSAFQQYAAEYCGCNVVDDNSVCRICGDKLLPFPEDRIPSLAEGKDCGSLELEANLDKSLCDSYQAAYQDGCSCDFSPTGDDDMVVTDDIIGFDCTICPGGESVPDPDLEVFGGFANETQTCGVLQVMASFTTDPLICAENYHGYIAAVCGCKSYVPPAEKVCTSICPDGSNAPNPDATAYEGFDDSGAFTNITCRQIEMFIADGESSQQICDAVHYLGVGRCGCEDILPPPTCTLCQDSSFPLKPIAVIANDTSCIEWAAFFWDEQDVETCSAFQQFAGQYCGCTTVTAEDDSVCRICGDKLLPAPGFPYGQDCGLIELEANLDKTLCADYQELYQGTCCDVSPPAFSPVQAPIAFLPSFTPNFQEPGVSPTMRPTPLQPSTVLQPVFNPAGVPTAFTPFPTPSAFPNFQPPIFAPITSPVVPPIDTLCTTVCPDELPVPKPFEVAFIEAGGLQITCGQLENLVASENSLLLLDCAVVAYIGVKICGCENVLPEAFCEICEDGSAPPNPAVTLDGSTTCATAAVQLADGQIDELQENALEVCEVFQATAGVYCGCQNPIASEDVCRICGDGVLLPNPQLGTAAGGEESCAEAEFRANVLEFEPDSDGSSEANCIAARSKYASVCCNSTDTSVAPTPAATTTFIPTNATTVAPSPSTSNNTEVPAPTPTDTNSSVTPAPTMNNETNATVTPTPAPTAEDSAASNTSPATGLIMMLANGLLVLLCS